MVVYYGGDIMVSDKPKINFRFNLILLAYLLVDFFASLLFEPIVDEKVPWDAMYDVFPVLSIVLAFIVGFLLLSWGAKLFESFWNKVISDIFEFREINYQEGLAFILVIFIIAM